MHRETKITKKIFEHWLEVQFPDFDETLLNDFHDTDGYSNEVTNLLWCGFCAGIIISDKVRSECKK